MPHNNEKHSLIKASLATSFTVAALGLVPWSAYQLTRLPSAPPDYVSNEAVANLRSETREATRRSQEQYQQYIQQNVAKEQELQAKHQREVDTAKNIHDQAANTLGSACALDIKLLVDSGNKVEVFYNYKSINTDKTGKNETSGTDYGIVGGAGAGSAALGHAVLYGAGVGASKHNESTTTNEHTTNNIDSHMITMPELKELFTNCENAQAPDMQTYIDAYANLKAIQQ